MARPLSSRVRRALAAVIVVVGVAGLALAPSVRAQDSHDGHGDNTAGASSSRVGLLLADHGEPPEYNAWTYESFREFFQHLIDMGLIPAWLTALETGTILYDADCPACEEPSDSPRLIDAWLRPHDGPAVFVPPSDSLAAHYVSPGGPGFREPDIFEHVGLAAWHEWQRMGGRSPNYDEKLPRKQAVIDRLTATYGDGLAIRVGYMIDPRFGGGRQGVREALDALVNRDRIDSLVVVYHGVGFSDIMQTHHLRHLVAEHLEHLGADIPVRFAEPPGTSDHYVGAVVEKVQAELAKVPSDAAVAVHLSGHGLPTTTCGEYDCGADAYHRSSADLFARSKPALEAAIDRPGRTEIFHLYGDGAEGDDDPDDKIDSPIEALDKRAAAGFTYVIDIPYEFDANSRDTLIVLRQGYRRDAPDWNRAWESHFTYKGMQVTIANANGGDAHKIDALHDVTIAALDGWLSAPSGASRDAGTPIGHHVERASTAALSGDLHAGAVEAAVEQAPSADEPTSHGPMPGVPRFDRVGATSRLDDQSDEAADDHVADVADGVGVNEAALAHHRADGGGASATTGLLLGLAGGAAVAMGVSARRRSLGGRLVLAGLGVQLAGLGWDVITHAEAGEAVHLLENGGHWLALGGLIATALAAAVLLRKPLATPTEMTA